MAAAIGGPHVRLNRAAQPVPQGQSLGRWRMMRRAEDAILAGMLISFRRIVAVVALASGASYVRLAKNREATASSYRT